MTLLEGKSNPIRDEIKKEENAFLESLKVSPEELVKNIENQQKENVQTKEYKKDGPSLDD